MERHQAFADMTEKVAELQNKLRPYKAEEAARNNLLGGLLAGLGLCMGGLSESRLLFAAGFIIFAYGFSLFKPERIREQRLGELRDEQRRLYDESGLRIDRLSLIKLNNRWYVWSWVNSEPLVILVDQVGVVRKVLEAFAELIAIPAVELSIPDMMSVEGEILGTVLYQRMKFKAKAWFKGGTPHQDVIMRFHSSYEEVVSTISAQIGGSIAAFLATIPRKQIGRTLPMLSNQRLTLIELPVEVLIESVYYP